MTFRMLTIGPAQKSAVARIVEFAEKPENWYRAESSSPPGDKDEHVLQLGDFRCVFSYTAFKGALYRHLSVSVPAAGNYPNPIAFCALASLFGFTPPPKEKLSPGTPAGFAKTWQIQPNPQDNCVVVSEKIRELMLELP